MKKWMMGVMAGVVVAIAGLYLFIPKVITLKSSIGIKATRSGINRMLLDKKNTAKWWPGTISNDSCYLNEFAYKINNGNITVLPVSIHGKNNEISTSLFLISINTDSTHLEWVGSMVTSYNPVKRFLTYKKAKKINSDLSTILEKMDKFYSQPENIYSFNINKAKVIDSFLIATSAVHKGYPGDSYIYKLVDKLRLYAIDNTAKESGFPMLNVSTTDSINFDVKVAIPIDKLLPSSGDILQKRMLGRGNILVAEVRGGVEIINQAIEQMQKYVDDYQRKTPAIPFCSLITDRTKEPDSSKWVTKIYFPVM